MSIAATNLPKIPIKLYVPPHAIVIPSQKVYTTPSLPLHRVDLEMTTPRLRRRRSEGKRDDVTLRALILQVHVKDRSEEQSR